MRWQDQLTRKMTELTDNTGLSVQFGKVGSVSPLTVALDAGVTIGGAGVIVPGHVTPAAGDTVVLLRQGGGSGAYICLGII